MGYRKHYSCDPYWITARYAGTCAGCGVAIDKGERAFYYPSGRKLYCSHPDDGCGETHAAEFESRAFDEDIAPAVW